eukprot:SAG11_NODE_1841_length_4182_cov_4.130541_2_plen_110_part_00
MTKFGAKGDAKTSDYVAVKAAAAACAKAGGGTVLFPVMPKALGRGTPDSPPCPPTPCPGKVNFTFCSSDPASGQCSAPPRRTPCPPCFNPEANMKTGYVRKKIWPQTPP